MIEPPSLHRYSRVSKEVETIGLVDEETHARADEPGLVLSDEGSGGACPI
jgi:hypothetical protein